jgi:predicted Zn-dependent protease
VPKPFRRALAAPLAAIIAIATFAPAEAQRAPARPSYAQTQQAQQEHLQIVQEFGGEVGGELGALADRVGGRIAAQAGGRVNPDFTVLNSPVANAFATPSGRVYVTRQLMALMNSEDELAFVLGHEAGHIAERHSRSRQNTGIFSQIGAALLGVLTGSSQIAQIAGSLGQQYLLSFSRSQEFESDQLGIRYMAAAGYDPLASTEILGTLGAYSDQLGRFAGRADDQRAAPTWNRTHPLSAERVARARREAQTARRTSAPIAAPGLYLRTIDGMIFDDDPVQGIVEGSRFLHPDLRLTFTAPAGYGIQNGTRAVTMSGRGGQAMFSTGAYNGDLQAFLGQAVQSIAGQTPVQTGGVDRLTVNGLPALATTARAQTRNGAVDLTVVAYEFARDRAYYFATIAPAGQGAGPFGSMINSLRPLTAQEAAAIRPRVIDVVTVGPRDTIDQLARRMAYPTLQAERFRVLNGLAAGETLRPGQPVKLVVYAARR